MHFDNWDASFSSRCYLINIVLKNVCLVYVMIRPSYVCLLGSGSSPWQCNDEFIMNNIFQISKTQIRSIEFLVMAS